MVPANSRRYCSAFSTPWPRASARGAPARQAEESIPDGPGHRTAFVVFVGSGSAQHPGCLPEFRAARSRGRDDSPDGRPQLRRAHQELRQVRCRRRSRRQRAADLQACDLDDRDAARGRELLLPTILIANPYLPPFSRVILIVLDSVGCGELSDAAAYGDEGSDTLGNIAKQVPLAVPRLRALGLDRVANIGDPPAGPLRGPAGAYGRMAERSPGKDSVTGHWEMMGVVLER